MQMSGQLNASVALILKMKPTIHIYTSERQSSYLVLLAELNVCSPTPRSAYCLMYVR
jgi:hypothetical protein